MYSYHLRVFHAVAKHGGYARAAREELFISQPAVSKHVQALEEEVGAKLFSRVGKRLELTEAGALVLQCAEQMRLLNEETRRAVRELQGLQRGTLRVGTSTTAGTSRRPTDPPGHAGTTSCRSRAFAIFPAGVVGSSSRISKRRGTL